MAGLLTIGKPFRRNPAFLKSIIILGVFWSCQCRSFAWPAEENPQKKSANTPVGFVVTALVPADGATGVANNTTVTVNFSLPANGSTLSYNATGGTCTGSVRMSSDSFATCIGFSGHVWNGTQDSVTFTLATALGNSTSYQVAVTTALQGAGGETLAALYTSTGFTTLGAPLLTVALVTPSDGQTGVSLTTQIVLGFGAQVNTGTVSHNSGPGTCTGSVQLSPDNFSTCAGLVSPTWNGAFTQLTLTPGVSLNPGALYRVKVTTAVAGTGGEVILTDFVTPSGFGTDIAPPAMFQAFTSDTRNMLVWQSVAGATSYNIYFSTSPGVTTGTGTLLSGVTAPYIHTGLTNGTTYHYIVTGVNGANIGQASAEVAAAPVAFKTIFVTSTTFTGNLGGLAGADSSCASIALGEALSGQFSAYLSDSTDDAVCRALGLSGKLASNCGLPVAPDLSAIGPYHNRNLETVASSLQALLSNTLSASVGYNESGGAAAGSLPFTGTAGGVQSGANCSDWTDSNLLINGLSGSAGATSAAWSSNGNEACSLAGVLPIAPIYCIQR